MGVGKQMAGTAPGIGFADRLLAWFEKAGRHDLPWQQDRSLYRVWVSEVMLQQTQVQTVIPYFERFMARFPTVQALASAAEDEVLHFWSGLGYYARARNLHAAARRVVSERGGDLPLEREQWNALPGVGRSTAGAILAQALDQRHAILDGNVRRVLARWAAIEGAPGRPEVEARLWQLSEHLTPAVRAADYTQAIMDLGATLCTRTRPRCDACPVRADCVARQEGRQALLPTPRKVRHRPERRVHWLVLENAGSVLLSRRPARGVWGGLHGFLEAADAEAVAQMAAERTGRPKQALQPLAPIRHAFTHFELLIQPWCCDGEGALPGKNETWYNLDRPAPLGLAAPTAAVVKGLRTR